jgi:hypothetical protein
MAAGAQRYSISETNPNESVGGAGCLCSETKCEDACGPYAVFYGNEMDSGLSPHVVLCAPCARRFVDAIDGGAEMIKAGEPVPVLEGQAELIEVVRPAQHENPVVEGAYPNLDAPNDDIAI